MRHLSKPLAVGLLLALLAGTWVAVRHYRQQQRLYAQLKQLADVLATENDHVASQAGYSIEGIKAAVVKNHNQPADLAVLRRAEALHDSTQRLLATLRIPRQRSVFGSSPPVAVSLAALTQAKSELLAQQTQVLRRLTKLVDYKRFVADHLLAVASAEANVVAPGDTYRAELFLVAHFGLDVRMQMTCNSHPIAVGPDGMGLVRFHAPTRPGRYTWSGTIRLNENGRDTTHQVTIPYRVARR